MVWMIQLSPLRRISLVLCQSPRLLAPLRPWSWRQYKLVKIRSWSLSPPYRLTGGSATVASDRLATAGTAAAAAAAARDDRAGLAVATERKADRVVVDLYMSALESRNNKRDYDNYTSPDRSSELQLTPLAPGHRPPFTTPRNQIHPPGGIKTKVAVTCRHTCVG